MTLQRLRNLRYRDGDTLCANLEDTGIKVIDWHYKRS
jgi:hypothetical protein